MNRVDTVRFNLCVGNAGGKEHQAVATVGLAVGPPGTVFPDLSLVSCFPVGHRSRGRLSLKHAEQQRARRLDPTPGRRHRSFPGTTGIRQSRAAWGGLTRGRDTGSSETPHPGEWAALAGVVTRGSSGPVGRGTSRRAVLGV